MVEVLYPAEFERYFEDEPDPSSPSVNAEPPVPRATLAQLSLEQKVARLMQEVATISHERKSEKVVTERMAVMVVHMAESVVDPSELRLIREQVDHCLGAMEVVSPRLSAVEKAQADTTKRLTRHIKNSSQNHLRMRKAMTSLRADFEGFAKRWLHAVHVRLFG